MITISWRHDDIANTAHLNHNDYYNLMLKEPLSKGTHVKACIVFVHGLWKLHTA